MEANASLSWDEDDDDDGDDVVVRNSWNTKDETRLIFVIHQKLILHTRNACIIETHTTHQGNNQKKQRECEKRGEGVVGTTTSTPLEWSPLLIFDYYYPLLTVPNALVMKQDISSSG